MIESDPDLNRLIEQGRGGRVDWFSEQSPISAIATTMTAMANTQGGVIVMGIAGPTGSALGVRDADAAVDTVLQAALAVEPPLIIPLPHTIKHRGLSFIIAQVPPGMPNVYALDGRYLIRENTDNVPLKAPALRRLIFERGTVNFETEIARGTTLDDINWDKVEAYSANLHGIGEQDPHRVLRKRGCLTELDGELQPTNAGILLFGYDPQRFIHGAEITAARFAGETMSDRFSKQDILGTLPDQIMRAETFLVDHLRKGVQLSHTMERHEQFEYPLEAARELVVNAVAHRDYSIGGDSIRLFLFKDRMEISNPGRLAGPVTVANIKYERFSRNPVIVQVLSDMGFIERLGYGVDRVIHLMDQQDLDGPEFAETAGGFQVILRNEMARASDKTAEAAAKLGGMFEGIEINPRQEAALVYLHKPGNLRITNSDLQQLCPDVHAETIRRDLVDLVSKNILQKMGQKRGSYYILKRD